MRALQSMTNVDEAYLQNVRAAIAQGEQLLLETTPLAAGEAVEANADSENDNETDDDARSQEEFFDPINGHPDAPGGVVPSTSNSLATSNAAALGPAIVHHAPPPVVVSTTPIAAARDPLSLDVSAAASVSQQRSSDAAATVFPITSVSSATLAASSAAPSGSSVTSNIPPTGFTSSVGPTTAAATPSEPVALIHVVPTDFVAPLSSAVPTVSTSAVLGPSKVNLTTSSSIGYVASGVPAASAVSTAALSSPSTITHTCLPGSASVCTSHVLYDCRNVRSGIHSETSSFPTSAALPLSDPAGQPARVFRSASVTSTTASRRDAEEAEQIQRRKHRQEVSELARRRDEILLAQQAAEDKAFHERKQREMALWAEGEDATRRHQANQAEYAR